MFIFLFTFFRNHELNIAYSQCYFDREILIPVKIVFNDSTAENSNHHLNETNVALSNMKKDFSHILLDLQNQYITIVFF